MIDAFRSLMLLSCSLSGPLSFGSPVVVFLDRGRPQSRNFYSTVLVGLLRNSGIEIPEA